MNAMVPSSLQAKQAFAPKLSRLCALMALAFAGPVHGGATLYAYGTAAGDVAMPKADDTFQQFSLKGQGPAGSSLSLSMYGKSYNDLFVNNNGSISFVNGVAAWDAGVFGRVGTPIVTPYWADVDTRGAGGGTVWSRTTQDAAFLTTMATDVKTSFFGATSFNPTFAEVVTWDHVGYFAQRVDKLNTFQLVLVSDGAQTYSIFKYPDGGIQWTKGQASSKAYASVGFDSGDGQHYFTVPGSGTAQTLNLPSLTNTVPANPGTIIFRINSASIVPSPTSSDPGAGYSFPTHTWTGPGGNGAWSVGGTSWTSVGPAFPDRGMGATNWANGDAAIFGAVPAPATVTLGGPVVASRMTVNSSGYTFTAAAAANSLQVAQLSVPTAATTVNFGGSLVLLTHADTAGLVWNGRALEQGGTLTSGHLVFTDTSVLVARDAGAVNGANLHLMKGAQLQLYAAGATTRASTLTFDNTSGGLGGTFDLRGLNTTIGAISSISTAGNAGLITSSGTAAARLTVDFDTVATTYNGAINNGTGGLALTKAGSGSLTLSGTNSYALGTTLAGGTLALGSAGALGASGSIAFTGGTLQFSAANSTDYSARFSHAANQVFVLDTNGRNVTLGTALVSTGGSLNKTGAGTLTLSAANTYTGGTTLSGGILALGKVDALPTGSLIFNGGTLQFSAANTVDYSARFSHGADQAFNLDTNGSNVTLATALVSTGGSLSKLGAGLLTLSGVNTYSGATTVRAGELKVNGSAANSALTVQGAATLSGSGQVGALTLAGVVSPGNSPGLLNAGATTFVGGSSYVWEINDATGALGVGYDSLAVNGTLTFAASASQPILISLKSLLPDNRAGNVIDFDPLRDYSYTLASATGGIVGFAGDKFVIDGSGFGNNLYGGHWSLAGSANTLDLNFTAAPVPEPQQLGMLLAGLLLVGGAARLRGRAASDRQA